MSIIVKNLTYIYNEDMPFSSKALDNVSFEIEDRYNKMQYQYNRMLESDTYTQAEIDEYWFELTKQRNLLEYGKDIVMNT